MIERTLPVVFIIIAIATFVGYINPVYTTKVLPLKAQIQQYNSALAAAADFNRKEAQLATERAAIPNDSIQRIETYLPDGVDNVQLILDLNALAARSGMQLSNFDIKDNAAPASAGALSLTSGNNSTDSIDLSVKATGTYASFRTFLGGIEKSLRPLDVVQMTVDDSDTGVYTYSLSLRIYWLH